jgi:hypothetical protein
MAVDFKKDAFCFHRTKQHALEEILNSTFRPGSGALYGVGMYTCYDLRSQLRSTMLHYGDYIIKYKTRLSRILCFDPVIAGKLYGHKYVDIKVQLEQILQVNPLELQDPFFEAQHDNWVTKYWQGKSKYNADVALPMSGWTVFQDWVKKGKLYGIIYTGSNDGLVLLMYNPNIAYPVMYTESSSVGQRLNWIKIDPNSVTDFKNVQLNNLQQDYEIPAQENTSSGKRAKAVIQVINYLKADDFDNVFRLIKANKLDPNAIYAKDPLIFYLVRSNKEEVVNEFLKLGGLLTANNASGKNILEYCIGKGFYTSAAAIIKNSRFFNPLIKSVDNRFLFLDALTHGHIEIYQMMINHKNFPRNKPPRNWESWAAYIENENPSMDIKLLPRF